jgi:hypothetical protein
MTTEKFILGKSCHRRHYTKTMQHNVCLLTTGDSEAVKQPAGVVVNQTYMTGGEWRQSG